MSTPPRPSCGPRSGNRRRLQAVIGNFERRILDPHQFPIPRLARSAPPFQLEGRGERIDSLLDHRREFTRSLDCDSRPPETSRGFCADACILHRDCGIPDEVENFSEPFEEHRPIISPAVLIVVSDKRGHRAPVFLFDLGEKMCAVKLHLPLGLPKSRQKNSHDRGEKKTGVKAIAEIRRHARG